MTALELAALADELTADQLAHIGASWVALAGIRRQAEHVESWAADPATVAAFASTETLGERLVRRAARSRSVGIDDSLIGCAIAMELLGQGMETDDVTDAVQAAGIDWTPRTKDERLLAAAREMLSLGLSEVDVAAALREVGE